MNQLLKYTLLLFLVTFAACSSDDDGTPSVPNGQPQPDDALELTVSAADFVTDGAPDTRATDNDEKTTFKDDDRVGVIILDAGNNLIYDNIPYVYNNDKWTFDSGNDEGKGGCYYDTKAVTYIVYYPYSRAADGVTSVDELKTKFAPKFNQSDIKDYRSSDLMVWDRTVHLASSETTLDAELKHAFASVYLAPKVEGKYKLEYNTSYSGSRTPYISDISDVSLTIVNAVYVPFHATDGTLRCIIPIDITSRDIRCFYTIGSNTYCNTISISNAVVANTRYACEPTIRDVTYSLGNACVGDFYCKNSEKGYLIPGDVENLTVNQKNACIGIVFWVGSEALDEDPLLKKDYPDCTHGLVVALQDAGSGMDWSNQAEYVQTWVNQPGNLYKDVVNIQESNKMCGYSNTLALVAYNVEKTLANPQLCVLPCNAIQQYSESHPAPKSSSGWYLPSITELTYVCWGQGKEYDITGRDKLNIQIEASGGSRFVSDYYWSSTESSKESFRAWYVGFNDGYVDTRYKYNYNSRVRPLLAF